MEPATPLPQGASPILDEELGLCIGYSVQRTEGVWHLYDADGRFVTIEEAPLEAPLIDPTLGFLTGLSVARHFRAGIRAVGPFLTRGGITAATYVGATARALLRARLRRGLSPAALKFADAPARHMLESGRYVPVQLLEKAIRYGRRTQDPRGSTAFRYQISIHRLVFNRALQKYEYREYALDVIVRESDWTILHFLYK